MRYPAAKRFPAPWRFSAKRLLLSALLVTGLGLSACGSEKPSEPREVKTYTVRGILTEVPQTALPGSQILVRHEPIDHSVDIHGETVGMDSMTMSFPIAAPKVLEGVSVGDKVTMTFELDWHGDKPLQVTAIKPLDPATELEFRKAKPPSANE